MLCFSLKYHITRITLVGLQKTSKKFEYEVLSYSLLAGSVRTYPLSYLFDRHNQEFSSTLGSNTIRAKKFRASAS